jgi:multidrug efflux pump subunit AcrA (membrane-fusion protein)
MAKTPQSRARRLWFVGTAFTTLTAIVGAIVTLQSTTAEATSAPVPVAVPVSVASVVQKEVATWDEFSGRLEAVERVDIRPRVAGTVQAVHFREGALVDKGELLVTIDPAPYAAEVERAEAQVVAAQARVSYTRSEFERARRLLDEQAIAQREFDERHNALREADANLRAAQAALQTANLSLGYTQVKAPVAGRVGNYFDWMTLKLDPAGTVLWSRRQNLHLYNDEIVNSLVLGPDGSVYLAGQGGPGPTSGTVSTTQAVVSRYASADGAQQGFYASLPGARAMAARLGSDGAVYMVAAGEQAVHRIRQSGAGISAIDNWPVAKAAAVSATSGAAPLAVSFSSAGSMDPDGTGIFTQWDFGDGSSSTLADPTHTYGTAGSFAATLTVTDFVGHAVKASPVVVTVTSAPPVAARPSALNFSATSVVGGNPVQATVVLTSTAGAIQVPMTTTIDPVSMLLGTAVGMASSNSTATSHDKAKR